MVYWNIANQLGGPKYVIKSLHTFEGQRESTERNALLILAEVRTWISKLIQK